MEKLVSLGFNGAVEAIKNEKAVMYRYGVWNSYEPCLAETAIRYINNSNYGADVYVDKDNVKYVSIPSNGDMW